MLTTHHRPEYQALPSKSRLLLVSFSESETAFLERTAKLFVLTGNWECNFLLLYMLDKNDPTADDFNTAGISYVVFSESQFFKKYSHNMPFFYGFISTLLNWWRRQKVRSPYLYLAVSPMIKFGFYIVWLFTGFIPYLARGGLKITLRKVKVFKKFKQLLRSNNPSFYKKLRKHAFTFQSFWDEINPMSVITLKKAIYQEEKRLKGYLDATGHFFAAHTPDILVLAKDSAYYPTAAIVQAARNFGIPSVLIPYDRADSVTLAKDRLGHPKHVIHSRVAREVAKKFPAWVYTHENQALLLVPPATIYAIEKLKLAPPNPWGYNNSRCDMIFLETERDRELFIKNQAPPDQLVVVGAAYMDSIDAALCQRDRIRDQLCSNFGFAHDKPFVVASVSPNKLSQRHIDLEFKNYRTLIDNWSSALVRYLEFNIIYSLHPLTKHPEVAFIEKKGGKFLHLPLEELIAVADLYVVDCSSTTHWARYAGVDVIDYDFYQYNLSFNSEIEGVSHIMRYDEFISELIKANDRLRKRQHCVTNTAVRQDKLSFKNRLSLELNKLIFDGD